MLKRAVFIAILIIFGSLSAGAQVQDNFAAAIKAMKNGEYLRAKDLFTNIIALDSKNEKAYYNRAMSYYYMNMLLEASSDLDQVIKIKPDFADAYNLRGIVKNAIGDVGGSLDDFNKAIELDPKFAEPYISRGAIYASGKKYDLAMADFNKAAKLSPNNPEIYRERGKVFHFQKQYEKAVKDYTKAINKGIKNAEIYSFRGNSYFQLNKMQEAINDYTECLKLDPENLIALNNRAIVYDRQEKRELAEKDRAKMKEINDKKYTPLDKIKFKTFSDSRNYLSIDLPDNWYMREDTANGEVTLTISKEELTDNDVMNVGVTFTIVPHIERKTKAETDQDILDYWENLQKDITKDYYVYFPVIKKNKPFHGYSSYTNQLEVQAKPEYIPYKMFEFVCAYNNNLVHAYMQSPKEDFGYYEQIYEKALESIKINPPR